MDFRGKMPLWTARWSEKALRRKLAETSPRSFERGYRMHAYVDSDMLFPSFRRVLELGELDSLPPQIPADWVAVTGVDLASKSRAGNVIFTGYVSPDGVRRPVDVRVLAGSSPKIASALADVYEKWKPSLIIVENNGYQDAIIEWCREMKVSYPFWDTISPFTTGSNKHDPRLGLAGLDVEFMNGSWILPREYNPRVLGHSEDCKCGMCIWVNQMMWYPHAAATDAVMASWFFREGSRRLIGAARASVESEMSPPEIAGRFEIPLDEVFGT